jgi:hypothetical protein
MTEEIPEYIPGVGDCKSRESKMMARFRYGNEEGEERRCRMCYGEREHIFVIIIFMFVIRNPKARRTNKALLHPNFAQ